MGLLGRRRGPRPLPPVVDVTICTGFSRLDELVAAAVVAVGPTATVAAAPVDVGAADAPVAPTPAPPTPPMGGVGGAVDIVITVSAAGVVAVECVAPPSVGRLPTKPPELLPLAAADVEVNVVEPQTHMLSSAGVVWPEESCCKRFTTSVSKSSMRPMRCCIRCSSRRTSTLRSKTVSEVVARDEAISICRSRSKAKLRSLVERAVSTVAGALLPSITTRLSRLGGDESTSPPSSIVS
ncbi:hypothetical protein FF38_10355 [Lucilia cuprina]|uniref:Uncharacterized protein n=1 Tax=Lucilia cuprina TaxID=7375 RepID=A0A0L0CHJ0_LUCCU|nr:hypothetical protein FF38_10355 [Lucilia cuprina]